MLNTIYKRKKRTIIAIFEKISLKLHQF